MTLQQATGETGQNTVQIWTAPPLAYWMITVKAIDWEKISLGDMQILRLFVKTLTAHDKYSLFIERI